MGGGTPALNAALATWSEAERNRFLSFVGWAHREKPRTWKQLQAKFTEVLPDRSEEDLRRICEALRQDMPQMPLPMPDPKA